MSISTTQLTHLPLDKMATILADDIFKFIFLNETVQILIQISLKFVPKNKELYRSFGLDIGLVPISDQPLSEPMLSWFTGAYMQH